MTRPKDDPPTNWSPIQPLLDVGGGIYVHVGADQEEGAKAEHVLVYHWHTPDNDEPRWELARCGLHTVVQLEPLTLVASLACENGCPNHGFITDGSWRPV